MKPNVLVVGTGKLGSRYVQGLAQGVSDLNIWAFDVSMQALLSTKAQLDRECVVGRDKINYVCDLDQLPLDLDITIVSTNSDVRADVVEELSAMRRVKYWILEKLLCQNPRDLNRFKQLLTSASGAWVNTPRHQWELYRKLKLGNPIKYPLIAKYENFSGLACNSIHFIDLVSRWNGAQLLELNTDALYPTWHKSKRHGYFEVYGRLEAIFADGSQLMLKSEAGGCNFTSSIKINGQEWFIDEANGIATSDHKGVIRGKTPLQSELALPTVREVLDCNSCGLPTLDESIDQHKVFLESLQAHWNKHNPAKVSSLPIT